MGMIGVVQRNQQQGNEEGRQQEQAHAGPSPNIMVEVWPLAWSRDQRAGAKPNYVGAGRLANTGDDIYGLPCGEKS
jgi:hypothetical protein